MSSFEFLLAGAALVATVAAGTVVHEVAHAAVLRAAGIPFELRWGGAGSGGRLGRHLRGSLASVRLRSPPARRQTAHVRAASMAPLVLLVPFLAVPVGLVPDPFATDSVLAQVFAIGWLACALPSPADFALLWHPGDVADRDRQPAPG